MKTVRHIMSCGVKSVRDQASIPDVLDFLDGAGVWGAPVVDEAGNAVGVVSRTDLALRGDSQSDGRITELKAQDLMTPFLFSVGPDEPLINLIHAMEQYKIHRVIVTEGRKPVGVVTTMDLISEFGRVLSDA